MLSNFHKQLLLCWNNQDICFKRKSLFFRYWVDNGLLLLKQLFNKDGQMFRYNEFLLEYNIPISPRESAIVFYAFPAGLKLLISSADWSNVHYALFPELFIGNHFQFVIFFKSFSSIFSFINFGISFSYVEIWLLHSFISAAFISTSLVMPSTITEFALSYSPKPSILAVSFCIASTSARFELSVWSA